MLVATLCSVVVKYIMLKLSSAKVWLAIVSVLLANENCRSVVTGTDDLAPSKVSNVMYGYSSAVALIASGKSSESLLQLLFYYHACDGNVCNVR